MEKVFQLNAHSHYGINWKPVSSIVVAEVKEILKDNYGWQDPVSIEQVGEWEQMSHNFRVQLRGGQFPKVVLVRKYLAIGPEEIEHLELVSRTTAQLFSLGVPTPGIIPTIAGDFFVKKKQNLWQVFEFVAGEHFRGTVEELASVARGIAKFHQALAKIPENLGGILGDQERAMDYSRSVIKPEDLKSVLDNQIIKVKDVHFSNGFRAKFMVTAADLSQVATIVATDLANFSSGRQQLIHHDLHPQNTLFANGHLVALLDFANLGFGELGVDVAMALHRFVRQYIVYQAQPWDQTLANGVEIFLNNYQSINHLPKALINHLPDFMRLFLLQKIIGNTRLFFRHQRDNKSAQAELNKFLNLLAEVDLFIPYLE